MEIISICIALCCGWLIWYFRFYLKFANKELINELRKNNLELKHTLQSCDHDRIEYEQQNIILKDEISWLYQKNDDLTHIVSELSRYYYHLKKISDKMDNLARDLQQPLEDLDRKIKPFMYESNDERNEEFVYNFSDKAHTPESWFF
jgi:hypothetical protein